MAKIVITLVVWCLAVAHGRSFFWNGPFSRSINNNGERIVASPMAPALMPCTHGYASSMVSPAYPSRYPVPQSAAMPSPYPLVYYIQPQPIMNSASAALPAVAPASTIDTDTISTNIVEPANKPSPNSGSEELQYTYIRPANLVPATPMSPMTGASDATTFLYSNPTPQRPLTMMTGMSGNDASLMYTNPTPMPVNEELQYQYAPATRPVAMTGADTSFYYTNAAWARPTATLAATDASYMYGNVANSYSRPVTAMTGADTPFMYQNPMSPGFASSVFDKQKPATAQPAATLPPATSVVEQQVSASTVRPPSSSGGTFPGITVPSFPTNTWQNYLCNVFPYLPSCGRNGTGQAAGETPNILTHGYTVQPTATTLVTTHQVPTRPGGPITPVAFYPPASATSMYPYGYSPYYTQMAQNPVYYYLQPELRPVDNSFPGVASSMGTIKAVGPQTFRPEQIPIHMQDSIRPIPGPKPVDPEIMTLAEAKAQGDQPSHSHFDNLEDIETQEGQSITYSKTPSTG